MKIRDEDVGAVESFTWLDGRERQSRDALEKESLVI